MVRVSERWELGNLVPKKILSQKKCNINAVGDAGDIKNVKRYQFTHPVPAPLGLLGTHNLTIETLKQLEQLEQLHSAETHIKNYPSLSHVGAYQLHSFCVRTNQSPPYFFYYDKNHPGALAFIKENLISCESKLVEKLAFACPEQCPKLDDKEPRILFYK